MAFPQLPTLPVAALENLFRTPKSNQGGSQSSGGTLPDRPKTRRLHRRDWFRRAGTEPPESSPDSQMDSATEASALVKGGGPQKWKKMRPRHHSRPQKPVRHVGTFRMKVGGAALNYATMGGTKPQGGTAGRRGGRHYAFTAVGMAKLAMGPRLQIGGLRSQQSPMGTGSCSPLNNHALPPRLYRKDGGFSSGEARSHLHLRNHAQGGHGGCGTAEGMKNLCPDATSPHQNMEGGGESSGSLGGSRRDYEESQDPAEGGTLEGVDATYPWVELEPPRRPGRMDTPLSVWLEDGNSATASPSARGPAEVSPSWGQGWGHGRTRWDPQAGGDTTFNALAGYAGSMQAALQEDANGACTQLHNLCPGGWGDSSLASGRDRIKEPCNLAQDSHIHGGGEKKWGTFTPSLCSSSGGSMEGGEDSRTLHDHSTSILSMGCIQGGGTPSNSPRKGPTVILTSSSEDGTIDLCDESEGELGLEEMVTPPPQAVTHDVPPQPAHPRRLMEGWFSWIEEANEDDPEDGPKVAEGANRKTPLVAYDSPEDGATTGEDNFQDPSDFDVRIWGDSVVSEECCIPKAGNADSTPSRK